MANKSDILDGTNYEDGNVLPAADQNDTNDAIIDFRWKPNYGSTQSGVNCIGMVATGNTALIYATDNNRIRRTTDYQTGKWTEVEELNAGAVTYRLGVAKDSKSDVIAITNAGLANFSVDGGETWTASNPQLSTKNVTSIHDVSYATGGAVVVAVGNSTSGDGFWYSDDGAATWTQGTITGTIDPVFAVDMLNATIGFALAGTEVYKTTDGGATWTAQGRTAVSSSAVSQIFAIDASTYIIEKDGIIYRGTTSVDPTIVSNIEIGFGVNPSKFVKIANGNIYIALYADATDKEGIVLFRSIDNGLTWTSINLGAGFNTVTTEKMTMLSEAADNILILFRVVGDSTTIMEINGRS